jgi:glutathione S-transferase
VAHVSLEQFIGVEDNNGQHLYLVSGSPYGWRVQLALEFKGLDYTAHFLSAAEGETQSAEFLALNPRGKVPVLTDGEVVVYESIAIMAYLERRFPKPPLFGNTPVQTGHIWQRLSEFESYADAPMRSIILPLYFGTSKARSDEIRAAIPNARRELATLEQALAKGQWLVDDSLTGADLGIYPFVKSLERAASKEGADTFDLQMRPIADHYPAIGDWMRRIEALAYYERTYPPHWK